MDQSSLTLQDMIKLSVEEIEELKQIVLGWANRAHEAPDDGRLSKFVDFIKDAEVALKSKAI